VGLGRAVTFFRDAPASLPSEKAGQTSHILAVIVFCEYIGTNGSRPAVLAASGGPFKLTVLNRPDPHAKTCR
jgi:hypothetical protein